MSETTVEKYDGFCSQINDKPVDAIGHMIFTFDFDHFKSPFQVEKVFGLMAKEANLVVKFKLILKDTKDEETDQEIIKFKLIYVNEESIECKFEEKDLDLQEQKHLEIGDELVNFVYDLDDLKDDSRVQFCIGLSLNIPCRMKSNLISRNFNDQSSSDFIIECQNKNFYVHQMILKDQSEYFEAILRNDCKENGEKKLIIEDFDPKIVETLLRYIYNGAFCEKYTQDVEMTISLMKISDKYNFTSLYDTIDSHLAQSFVQWKPSDKTQAISVLKMDLQICQETGAPKLATMLFYNRSKLKDWCELNNKEWSNLVRKHPNFAMVATITAGREDYQTWMKQHRSWCFEAAILSVNDFSLIVGKLGEIKGSTKCYPI